MEAETLKKGLSRLTHVGKQRAEAQFFRALMDPVHEDTSHSASRAVPRHEEMIDVAVVLKVRIPDDAAGILNHERPDTAHSSGPPLDIWLRRRPGIYLFWRVVL